MMTWNASFIRGLAQGVLDRARSIREGLEAPAEEPKREVTRKKPTKPKARG